MRASSQVVGFKNMQGKAVNESFYTDSSLINEPIYERKRGNSRLINV